MDMAMRTQLSALAACALSALFAADASALAITAISLSNNSQKEEAAAGGTFGRLNEWHTAYAVGPVVQDGPGEQFTSRFQWYNGFGASDPYIAKEHARDASYDLLFTVNDPLNAGYRLSVASLMQGYSTAAWSSGFDVVTASGTRLSGRMDVDALDGNDTLGTEVAELTLDSDSAATASSINPFVHNFDSVSDLFEAGRYSGTRTFAMRFATEPLPTLVSMDTDAHGQGAVRFGLGNALTGLGLTGQPQTGDLDNPDLGHFVTVSVSQAPVPAAAYLFLGALPVLARFRKRRGA